MMQLFAKLAFLVSIVLSPTLAHADFSSEAKSNGATMRIASLPVDGQGKIEALLDIQLEPEWITYWREPGAAGIPPQITVTDPSVATLSALRFPVPKKIMLGKYLDIGYDAPVTLPFTVTLADPARQEPVHISVLIGVCKDICIPFTHEFTVDPKAGSNTIAISQMVSQAQALLPPAPSADFKVDSARINDNRRSVDLTLTVPEGTSQIDQVIIAGPAGHAYTLVNEAKIDGTKASLNVDAISLPKDYVEAGKTWTSVITIGNRSMETELKFPSP